MRDILICDGASASSRKKYYTLASVVRGVLGTEIANYRVTEIDRTLNVRASKAALQDYFLARPRGSHITVICKSQGAWRVLDFLMHNSYQDLHIRVLSIDPHHWANGIRKMCNRPTLRLARVRCINFYQTNHWPEGCIVIGADNCQVFGCDHTNIVRHADVLSALSDWTR